MKKLWLLFLVSLCSAQNITQPPPTPQQRTVSIPAFVPQYLPPYPALAGLKVYVSGGNIVANGTPIYIPSQYVYLQPNTTSYVYVDMTNAVIAQSSSGFPTTAYPVCTCTTNGTMITGLTDSRPDVFGGGSGGGASSTLWNNLLQPQGNLSLAMGTNTTSFTSGDFGTGPSPAFWSILDSSVSTTDTTTNFSVGTGNNSYHQPFSVALTTGGTTFPQFQVCNTGGTSHVGISVFGNVITCPNLSITPYSKVWILDGSNHTSLTLYNNNASLVNPMMRFNSVATGTGFNFWQACPGAPAGVDGSCPSANIVAYLRGDGLFSAANYIGPLNGVTFSVPPASATGYVCTLVSQTGCTWQPQSGSGGGGTGAQYQTGYYSASNVLGAFGPGKIGQVATSAGPAAPPAYLSAGVGGSTVSTVGPYLIQCDSSTTTLDRLTTILFTYSGTASATVPDPTDTGCGSNFTFAVLVATGTTLTVNREAAGTFTTINGSTYSSGLTTFSLSAGQYATFNAVSSTVYIVRIVTGIGTNLLVTGILDGKAPVAISTGTSVTLGGTYNSGYTFNQEGTAAAAVTYILPPAAAGRQYCVSNSYNGSAATTGALELLTSASGQFVIFTDGTLSATGGYVLSSGAAGDAACVVGVDSTHWQLYVQRGNWAKH